MNILDDINLRVEAAVFNDYVNFEGARVIELNDRAAIAERGGHYKCVFANVAEFAARRDMFAGAESVCAMNMPERDEEGFFAEQTPCKTFAFFDPMPPVPQSQKDVEVRRLASSLAEFVHDNYINPGDDPIEYFAELMRTRGVFGAIANGKLAGFIGTHGDGSMGMLTVLDAFRRRGIGELLERSLICYVMTFGRTPFCDVYVDNAPSLALQAKLGLDPAHGYTYWI